MAPFVDNENRRLLAPLHCIPNGVGSILDVHLSPPLCSIPLWYDPVLDIQFSSHTLIYLPYRTLILRSLS